MQNLFKECKNKGEFAYFSAKRRVVTIQTVIFFFISFSLYLMGYITTGSNKNLLTFVAVLGLLPASKSLISAIMYYRYSGCSASLYEEISPLCDDLTRGYGFVFTSYDENFEVPVAVCHDGYVYGVLAAGLTSSAGRGSKHKDPAAVKDAAEKHITERLKADGLSPKVFMFTDKDAFAKRLKELKDKGAAVTEADVAALAVLKQISL